MIKTPLSIALGGAFWTPGATIIGSSSKNLTQLIKSIFATGEQGFAYDPSDLTTLYQDAAGAIPVTAAGQPVGLMLDKSGRNNHASQTVSASRPILQRNATTGAYYLAFDGADDFLQTSNIDFTATDKVSLFAGVRKLSDVATACVIEHTDGLTTSLGFSLLAPSSGGENKYDLRLRSGSIGAATKDSKYNAPNSSVVTGVIGKSSTIKTELRLNSQNTTSEYIGTYIPSNAPIYIGRRGGASLPFNGHIYGLIGIGRLTTDSETAALEKSIAKNTGVTLGV